MKDTKNNVLGSATHVAAQLLHENEQILFLPIGCKDLKDSNYEPYLDCPWPESVICFSHAGPEQLAIGDGFNWFVLLDSDGTSLRFTSTARHGVPSEVERLLQHQMENLGVPSGEGCASDFVEWLYRTRPTRLLAALEYFLAVPEAWLIGLPMQTPSTRLFSAPRIHADQGFPNHWFPLCHMIKLGDQWLEL